MQGYTPGEQPQGRRYIKLNTNENPYPPSPKVLEALTQAISNDLRLYPDPEATALREKASEIYGISAEQIMAGNGSDDLLSILFRVCADPDSTDHVAYPTPTYSLYDTLAAIQGTTPATVPFPPDFTLPSEALLAKKARLNIICNPNAPSGTLTPLSVIEAFAQRAQLVQGLVVVDEAYVDFCDETALPLLARCPNMVVLRTFSKSFSLAGMRVGLAFGSTSVMREMHKVKDSYNLDRLSIVAGRAALEDYPWMQANVARIREARELLQPALRALGFRVQNSSANFIFARTPSGDASKLYQGLKELGILVRYFTTPALRDGLRITVGTPEENQALVDALKQLVTR